MWVYLGAYFGFRRREPVGIGTTKAGDTILKSKQPSDFF